jgi:uncharacterized protein (TIGR03435 family)
MKMTFTAALLVAVLATHAAAQKAFEVASVKPNDTINGPSPLTVSPGRFSWTNATFRQLIQTGYDVRPYQLTGLPAWADTSHFDVMATTDSPASPQQMNAMLQALLADRFDLSVHHEQRDLPGYALMLARRDGKLGPNIHTSSKDCESAGAKPLDSAATKSQYDGCSPQMGLARLKLSGYRISFLVEGLKRIFEKPVFDQTSLSGTFDMELSWTPDPTMLPTGVPAPTAGPSGPSIFTALEEQLGLKLVSDRIPVDVLVIDRVNHLKSD